MADEVKDQAQPASANNPETSPQQPSGAELNISDLMALRSIVDVASQRGAFKAAELESVGKIYNKLNNFLESVSKKEA